ncbi:centromere protein F isoform X2 [Homo sapiens]|uniref:Centromere protein F n=1 Tax=Homo sapiens TaxID=9606 RepID=A0A9L9PXU7_HUMAN|nr:centromere protein F isoform X2 [Homo sapiens]|eukprot:XP_011507384.1 centromere protein F isoform X2 [Homo sapiens]
MSWALEEWKEGLPTRALQKIQELEGQLDKLKKEKQQRQFQLDSLEAALQKQKQKVENEKTEGTNLKRENQRLMEICESLEKTKQKISHELQVKESQVNFQEGQLNSGKKQIEKLEQELKRCKSELERSQQAAQSADVSLNPCNTPQKIFTTPLTPSQYYSGSKYEDLKEKYNKEVEERKRLEAEVKALQAKKASQTLPQATMNHRDIARHQASSSVFSWQQEKTPSHLSSNSQRTPIRRDFSASYFSGEQEVTPSRSTLQIGKRDANSSFFDNSSSPHLLDQLKAQNQELRNKINELELRLQGHEKEMKGQVNKFQELQLQLEKAKVELIEKEKVLNKCRDELVRTTAQYDQASTKYTALEQKLKKLTEDLSCQRQNAESARCSLEQKIKEKEKEFQEELSRQQRSFQTLDQECIQMKARLTQELQQAKNMHNVLQAELDKLTSVKQQLENNLEEFKQKLCRAEQAFQASQIKENELRRSMEEMKKENNLLKSHSEQKAREVCHLEAELKNIKQCLNQSQNFAEEMKAKNTSQETMLRDLQEKINQQENSLTLEKLKLAVADLEKQRDCSQDLLKKREHHIEQLNDKLSKTEKESKALLSALELKKKEYEELKEEKTLFSCWKSENEKLLTQMESEKENLQSKINHLETCLKTQQIKSHEYNERVRTLEMDRENLSVEIRNLHNVLDSKSVEVETQKLAYMELQQKAEFSDQKHQKEIENMCLKTSQLTGQVEDLEHKLQLLSNEIMDKDRCYQDLHAEYESLRDLLKSKDASLVTNEDHQRSLLAFDQQPAMHHSFANIIGEQGSMPSERSECRLEADQSPKNSAILQNRVDSLEFSLESQKQMNSDLQKQCEELVQIKGEIEENLMKAEQMHQSFVAETSQRISKLQEDTSAHQNVVAETLSALENKEKELQLLNDKVETEQAEIQELKKSNHLLEDSLKELQLLSETLSLEKKEMSSIISLNKREIEELTQENGTLKEINASLNQEKMNLIQKSESFANYIDEREKSISELSDQYKQEKLILLQRCEETGNAYEDLSQKYKAAQEKNSKLECLLNECTSLCENRKNELEQLKEAFAKEHQEFLTKLAFAEERNQNLMLELETVQQALRSEMTDNQNNSKSEAGGLKQEIMTLKEEQNKMQKEVNDLLQENEQLMKVMKTKHECQNLESEPIRNSVKERESERNQCNFKPQMDLEVKEISLDSYNAQLVQLEAMLRNKELKLQESEKEKECLQHELQTIRGDLETSNLQDMQSQEISGLKDCEIDAEEKYISGPHELSTSQNDNAHLQCSLQTTMNKLNELEKICEILQAEKYELVTELNDSRSECITATRKMAEEVGKLLNEVKILNDDSGLLHGELVEDIPGGEFGEQPNEQHPVSLAPLDESNSYEHLTLSDKEVQMHFAELQEKFLSLQSEHKILHDQHCQMSSKMSELQTYVDSLKAENLVLSTNLRNFQGDLVKEMQLGLEEGLVPSLSSSCVPDSSSLSSLGDSSFYRALLEQTGDMSLLSNLEGAVSANQCSVDEVFCSSLQEENLTRKETPSAPAKGVEELESLCEVYRQSLEKLEEKMESQGIMKNKEIQELEQLLSSERQELDCLRKQYLSENEQWQQKLTSVTLEMESKLAAEKKQTEQLSLELEVARLQLQGLDLSSRSLLGIDTEDAIQGRNESCDISKEHTSETTERTPKHDVHQICDKDAQQDLNLDIEKITETGAVKPTGECSGEQSPDTNYEPPGEDKTQGSSECISELSFSGPNALVPMDFLGNQEDIHNLQLRVKETSNENLRLLHVIEDRDRKVESLLNEMKELDSKLHLQEVQLMTKIEACIELEKIVGELKKENSDLSEKLEYFSCDHQELLQRVETSEGLNSDLEMHADKSSREDIGDNVAKVNDSWKERFLDVENELSRIRSEKASIEHEALYLEADLEVVQTEKLCLEKDNENKQKVIVCLEEELSVVTSERNQLRGELDTMSKKTTALDQLSEKMKEKTQELESHQSECLHCIQVAEAEVKEKTELLQTLSSDVSELLKDKTHLQEKLQSLEKDSQALSLTKCELENQIAQLNKEKELLVKESESLQARLSESDYEKLNVSKALEAALVEKGEFALRLSSTQEEVHQLRRGIEKLRVRIEADEKKQLHIAEKLKERERENDSLKDKVENLERELQMSEENQELVILDAENSKAEVETLKTQIEEMARSLKVFELDLVTLRSEKENLTKQIQEKQGQLSELDKLLSSFKSLLEEKEQAEIQIKEESKTAVEMLQNQLKELNEAVAALCGDQEIMKATEQSLDPPIEEEHQLRNSIEKLRARLEADEKKQLCVLQQLKESEHHADLLKGRVENLERELEIARTNQEHAALEAENSKGEVETLKAKIEGMTQSLRGLELDVVTIRSEKENLTNELQKEQERISELEIINSSFENILQEKEQEKVQMKEKSSTAMEMLQTQLKELNERVAALHNDQEACKAKEQNLSSQVECLELEKAQLLQGLDEAKNNYIVLQSSVNGLIQEVEDGKQKLEKKDEEISRLKNQIQDQEQLVSKLSQVEGEHQLWKEQNLELRNLTVELEQKIQVLQSKNASLQDTLEVLQSSYKNLENELELTKMDKMSFVEKVNKMTAKETELQREMHEMAQKTAELQEELSGEKNRLAGELQLLLEEIKSSKYEVEIQTYREKLTSKEECLSSQKLEIDLLKSSKEELNNSLKATTQILEELKKTKMDNLKYVNQLKKENERAQGKMKLLIKSCKQLEEEKEILQKELSQLQAAQEKQKTGTVMDTKVDELTTEIKELKETLEEKTKEADEYLDKYCSLLISHEKLEKAKEMLETQVAHLCSQQSKQDSRGSPLLGPVVPGPSPIPSVTEKRLSSGQNKASGKRQRSSGIWENGRGPTPATPESFSKKSKKAVMSGIHPAEDTEGTEFEPEGLPEVVKKGFADIPTGKTSPYILRRTTMATRTSPRLAAQKLALSPLSLGKENLAESSKPTAGGSRSQKVKVAQRSPVDSGTILREPTTKSVPVNNLPERSPTDSPREGLRVKRGRLVPSPKAGLESNGSENCKVQ